MSVILNEVKNLIILTESTVEILRLSPQNDIATQSLRGEGKGERRAFLIVLGDALGHDCFPGEIF